MACDTRIYIILAMASCCRADGISIGAELPTKSNSAPATGFLRAPGLLELHGPDILSEKSQKGRLPRSLTGGREGGAPSPEAPDALGGHAALS